MVTAAVSRRKLDRRTRHRTAKISLSHQEARCIKVVPLVKGLAKFDTANLQASIHKILARYAGDATYASGKSSLLTQTVSRERVSGFVFEVEIADARSPTLDPRRQVPGARLQILDHRSKIFIQNPASDSGSADSRQSLAEKALRLQRRP
jgi:hypothetical protein